MKISPQLHLLLPTYNRAHILESTLENVLNQDCDISLWHLTVVDNCSSDRTEEILKKYEKKHKNFDYTINDSNLGLFGNLNRCIDLSRTKKFMIIHSDDTVEKDLVSRAIEISKFFSNCGMIFGQSKAFLAASDETIENWNSSNLFGKGMHKITNNQFFNALMSSGSNFIFAPSVIYEKDFFNDLRYSLEYSWTSDLDLWFKASKKKGFIGVYDKPLLTCHIHSERLSEKHSKKMRLEYLEVCKNYLNLMGSDYNIYGFKKKDLIMIYFKLLIYKIVISLGLVPGFKARRQISKFINKISSS